MYTLLLILKCSVLTLVDEIRHCGNDCNKMLAVAVILVVSDFYY